MCLAIPARVMAVKAQQMITVNIGGIEKDISAALIETVNVGDYVIVHVGYALGVLDQEEAMKTLSLLEEIENSV